MLILIYVLLGVLYGIWPFGFLTGFWRFSGDSGVLLGIWICMALHIGLPIMYEVWKKVLRRRIESLDLSIPVTKESMDVYFGYKKADAVAALMQLFAKRIVLHMKSQIMKHLLIGKNWMNARICQCHSYTKSYL